MSHCPPTPVMSVKEPHRPSTFPLSKYHLMRNNFLNNLSSLTLESDLIDKSEVEFLLSSPLMKSERPYQVDNRLIKIFKNNQVEGLLRIPDIVRLKTYDNPGVPQYSQANLKSVIEMKFPGDILSPAQQEAYKHIAGAAGLRVLYTETCECADRQRWREWIKTSEKDPVYKPVQQTTRLVSRDNLEKNKLLVGRIDAEHETARRLLGAQLPQREGPQLVAAPDTKHIEEQNRRAVAGMEMVLAAPFVIVGSVAIGTVAVPGAATSSGRVVAQSATQTVSYRAVLEAITRKFAPSTAVTAAPAFAQTSEASKPAVSVERDWNDYASPSSTQAYVIWENAPVNIYD